MSFVSPVMSLNRSGHVHETLGMGPPWPIWSPSLHGGGLQSHDTGISAADGHGDVD